MKFMNMKSKEAVSPVIAVILMVAITVVLAATVYVWVGGFGGGGAQAITLTISQTAAASGNNVTFRVDSASQGADWVNLEYQLNSTGEFAPIPGHITTAVISAGETFTITGKCVAGTTVTIRDKAANTIIVTKTVY